MSMGIDREWEKSAKRVAKSFHKNSWHNKMYEMCIEDRRGYVYILRDSNGTFKIGRSVAVEIRMQNRDITLSHKEVELVYKRYCKDAISTEKELHRLYPDCHIGHEWFLLTQEQLQDIINYAEISDLVTRCKPVKRRKERPRKNPIYLLKDGEKTRNMAKITDPITRSKWVDLFSDGAFVGRASEFENKAEFISCVRGIYGDSMNIPNYPEEKVQEKYIRYMPKGWSGEFEDGVHMLTEKGGCGATAVYVLGGDKSKEVSE